MLSLWARTRHIRRPFSPKCLVKVVFKKLNILFGSLSSHGYASLLPENFEMPAIKFEIKNIAMLSQCPLDQFIFKIRVLLNKTVEFSLTCLSCSPIAALSSGSRHYSRKGILFSQMAKEKNCAKASGSVITCWVTAFDCLL